ncbi:MAG: hypothetical protein ACLFVQ_02855 [Chitinispirillaceae bacterium]
MGFQVAIAVVTLAVLFILFLVISKTMNSIVNMLYKFEYLVQKEYEVKQEAVEVKKVLVAQQIKQEQRDRVRQETEENE